MTWLDHWVLEGHEPVAVDLLTWARWFETSERHVARTTVGEADVSTVFLGIDHNFEGRGGPVLFETMIFGGAHSDSQWRYRTWDEAAAGHARIVDALNCRYGPRRMRRYAPMKPSRGTVIPPDLRRRVVLRDKGCVGFARLPGNCDGAIELDHVRASHGIGMKSETSESNLVSLCGAHHRFKTVHGREVRPVLLAYLERVSA